MVSGNPEGEGGDNEADAGQGAGRGGPGSLTPRVRATRHVVWAMLVTWLVLVALAVVLVAVL